MLKSRTKYKREEFVDEFLKTLKAGIIKRKNFINWNKIYANIKKYNDEINFLKELFNQKDKLNYLKNSLLSADDPTSIIQFIFNILGHTPESFVTWEDNIKIKDLKNVFLEENEVKIDEFILTLREIGFENILNKKEIEEIYFGVLIGLETHKRKNVGGSEYFLFIEPILKKIILEVKEYNLKLKKEVIINYGDNSKQSKKVDFAIFNNDKLIIGIEINFYTNTGSKPTEIKRAYGTVNQELKKLGIELIWITDGFGYTKMKKSLGDAFEIHKNTYNTNMVVNNLKDDILYFLKK